MRKIAIYVEGSTELIFVREYICKRFEYQNIDVQCRKRQFGRFDEVPHSITNAEADFHFRIIDSGNDAKVLDDMLEDEEYLQNLGYGKIVGLRDMFSEDYKKVVKQPPRIEPAINQRFIETAVKRVTINALQADKLKLCFAIMEVEAWLLGIPALWQKQGLSSQQMDEVLGKNHESIDPEITFFHPTREVETLLSKVNKSYDKHAKEVNSLLGNIKKEDFEQLDMDSKCASFSHFVAAISIK